MFLGVMVSLGISALHAEQLTKEQAKSVASEFLAKVGDAGKNIAFVSNSRTAKRQSGTEMVQPYYVFSSGAGRGYVIVSGDDSTTPVIGYTEQGDFDFDALPCQLADMLNAWERIVEESQAQKIAPLSVRKGKAAPSLAKKDWASVEPLIKTHWHQSSPYNDLCPINKNTGGRCVTGCVATASAQVIYYFRKDNPDSLLYDTPTYGYGDGPVTTSWPKGTKIEYDKMLLSGRGTAAQNNAVAVLMAATGASEGLTYGSSTAGQIYDANGWCALKTLRDQYHLDNEYGWKGSFSQTGWEQLIYNNLSSGRPLLYTGVHEESGGHAVVLDGFQQSTGLFHFNFGWGGQGDGYFTVDDETGMNHFNGQQSMLYNITPRHTHSTGSINNDFVLYQKCLTPIEVTFTNDATLGYTGELRLYVSTNGFGSLPNSPSGKTLVTAGSGETVSTIIEYRPALVRRMYLSLTDNKNNVLDTCSVDVLSSRADLTLRQFSVDAGTATETVDGYTFGKVNNTTATVAARFTNGYEGSPQCETRLRCYLYTYDAETKTWSDESVKSKSLSSVPFEAGQTVDTIFTFTKLTPGVYYKAVLDRETTAGEKSQIQLATDSAICFVVSEPTLEVSAVAGREARVSGAWNATLFAEKAAGKSFTSYDLTAVEELNSAPVTDNPNAVFVAAHAVPGAKNMVVDGVCEELELHSGHDFAPAAPFKAHHATMTVKTAPVAGLWHEVVVPFKASIPYGVVARHVTAVKTASVTLERLESIEALEPTLFLSDWDRLNTFEGTDVAIAADTVKAFCEDKLTAYTTTGALQAGEQLFGYTTANNIVMPYYLPVDEEAMVHGALTSSVTTTGKNGLRLLANLTTDAQFMTLADTLNRAKTLLAEMPDRDMEHQKTFKAEVETTEAYFMAQEGKVSEVKEMIAALSTAMANYLEGCATGIATAPHAAEGENADAPTEYYSLSGMRLTAPQPGIVIVKKGQQSKKILVR